MNAQRPGDPTAPRDLRVLIIDDQSSVRAWVRELLGLAGVDDVEEAANGRDALKLVAAPGVRFDLILCDLHMPVHDGVETIRSLGALGTDAAIVIMSVEDDRVVEIAGSLARLQGLHLLGTITKPMSLEKLTPILGQLSTARRVSGPHNASAPEHDLADAFVRRELELQYQPKIDVRTSRIVGVEALVRWKHPTLGLFEPAAFMPALERSDAYTGLLTTFSLEEGIACAGRWRRAGRDLHVAINLSAGAFDHLDLPERIGAIARGASVPPAAITIEITETQVARDAIRLLDIAMRLRLMGFKLSVDDFGVGQSGLAQLQRLPFTELKIDRQFVDGCATSTSKRSVVAAGIGLAQTLRMTSVAEGVQRQEDWDALAALGCDVIQGYLVARPMREGDLELWAQAWSQHAPR